MLDWNPQPPYTAEQLLQVIRILRDPENGCPWDKVQTHASIRKNFLEETCEALEAIDADDAVLLREELGDVLLQVLFHARMEQEAGRFDLDDVADGVNAAKMGYVDDVIEPSQTRQMLAAALEMLSSKRDSRLPKKHGNLPL